VKFIFFFGTCQSESVKRFSCNPQYSTSWPPGSISQQPLTKASPAVDINGPEILAGAEKPDWINFTMKSDYYKIGGQMHVLISGETPGP
jgi:hypothetical protein